MEGLADQLEELEQLLLAPLDVDEIDGPSRSEQVAINSYLVLAHAVIEEFIEDAFLTHVVSLLGWHSSEMVPRQLSLLTYAASEHLTEKLKGSQEFKVRTARGLAEVTKKNYEQQFVAENHGIKDHNIQRLANGTGLEWKKFENALANSLADLTTLGSKRGAPGHLSPFSVKVVAVSEVVLPANAVEWVYAARRAAENVQTYLLRLRRSEMPESLITDWDGN